jgi:hypothetical protein
MFVGMKSRLLGVLGDIEATRIVGYPQTFKCLA